VPNGDYAAFIDAYFREQGIPRENLTGELVTATGKWSANMRGPSFHRGATSRSGRGCRGTVLRLYH